MQAFVYIYIPWHVRRTWADDTCWPSAAASCWSRRRQSPPFSWTPRAGPVSAGPRQRPTAGRLWGYDASRRRRRQQQRCRMTACRDRWPCPWPTPWPRQPAPRTAVGASADRAPAQSLRRPRPSGRPRVLISRRPLWVGPPTADLAVRPAAWSTCFVYGKTTETRADHPQRKSSTARKKIRKE